MKIKISALKRLIREALTEVDTDPSNNPGRPQDAYEYLGMRPKPTDAMAHPSLGGGGGGGGGMSSSSASGGSIDAEFDAASADVESGSADVEAKEVKESRRRRYRQRVDEYKEFTVTFAELRSAWHAIAEEYGTSNEDDSTSFARLRTDVAFQRLLKLCDWTLSEWNAEVAAADGE